MKQEGGRPAKPVEPLKPGGNEEYQPVSNTALAVFFAALAAALLLGYLLVNKLADISQEEDCMLAHRRNCAAVELPSSR